MNLIHKRFIQILYKFYYKIRGPYMDKKLTNFLEQREHTVLTDIDVITAAVAVPLLESMGKIM